MRTIKLSLLVFSVLFLASSAYAVERDEPSESYVSLTFLAGLGTETDRFGGGDVTRLSVALDYPLAEEFSFLARFDHDQTRWDDLVWRSRCLPLLDTSTGRDVFSFGMRFNFK